jgi:hypothetical protein
MKMLAFCWCGINYVRENELDFYDSQISIAFDEKYSTVFLLHKKNHIFGVFMLQHFKAFYFRKISLFLGTCVLHNIQ